MDTSTLHAAQETRVRSRSPSTGDDEDDDHSNSRTGNQPVALTTPVSTTDDEQCRSSHNKQVMMRSNKEEKASPASVMMMEDLEFDFSEGGVPKEASRGSEINAPADGNSNMGESGTIQPRTLFQRGIAVVDEEGKKAASEREHEDDDEQRNMNATASVIAIGIPSPASSPTVGQRKQSAVIANASDSSTIPTSLAISQAVAETLAEEEHDAKQKAVASDSLTTRRTSLRSSTSGGSSSTSTTQPSGVAAARASYSGSSSNDEAAQAPASPRRFSTRAAFAPSPDAIADPDLDRKQRAKETGSLRRVSNTASIVDTTMDTEVEPLNAAEAWALRRASQQFGTTGTSAGTVATTSNPPSRTEPSPARRASATTSVPSVAAAASATVAPPVSLAVRHKSEVFANGQQQQQVMAQPRAPSMARSHRHVVPSAAAAAWTARSMEKEEQEQLSMAPARAVSSKSLLQETDWTELNVMEMASTAPVSVASHSQRKPPPHGAAPGVAASYEDRVQAKIAAQNDNDFPMLAPARATSSSYMPSTAAAAGRSRMDAELALMPAVARSMRSLGQDPLGFADEEESLGDFQEEYPSIEFLTEQVSDTPELAMVPSQGSGSGSSNAREEIVANAGVQVGAFAVQGIGNSDSASTLHYDNLAEDAEQLQMGIIGGSRPFSSDSNRGSGEMTGSVDFADEEQDMEGVEMVDLEGGVVSPDGALHAELAPQPELVDANIVHDDDEEYDEKTSRRLRLLQLLVLCGSVLGVVCVIVAAANGFGTNGGAPIARRGIPVITGWKAVGNQTFFSRRAEEDLTLVGHSVRISHDGTRIVATAPGADQGEDLNVGETVIFYQEEGNTQWQELAVLPGLGANENPTSSLSISETATCIAVGYPLYHDDGRVQVFEQQFDSSGDEAASWQQAPTILSANEAANVSSSTLTGFGYAVDLSPEGTLLAIGAPLFESQPDAVTGFVRVYARVEPPEEGGGDEAFLSWVRLGGDLQGTAGASELFGWSVSLRNNRVAIGGPANDIDQGLVRVFEFNSEARDWQQVGNDILGSEPLARFGESVALSDDATVLAVGARGTAFDPGQTRIYRLQTKNEETTEWVADEQVFGGQASGDGFGASVALAGDGNTVVVGAPENAEFGVNSGHVQVWQYLLPGDVQADSADDASSHQWKQQGSNIGGVVGSNLGTSVAIATLNDQGLLRIVGGAPGADFDGSVVKAGSFFVFDREEETQA